MKRVSQKSVNLTATETSCAVEQATKKLKRETSASKSSTTTDCDYATNRSAAETDAVEQAPTKLKRISPKPSRFQSETSASQSSTTTDSDYAVNGSVVETDASEQAPKKLNHLSQKPIGFQNDTTASKSSAATTTNSKEHDSSNFTETDGAIEILDLFQGETGN